MTRLVWSPEQSVFILEDVNSCDLSTFLPALHQYVDCLTRLSHILDKCYGNIVDGYKAICCLPLGKSDHSVVHLFPRYRAKIKQEKPIVKQVHLWTEQSKEQLKDCFEQTDWQLFFNASDNVHDITSYLNLCESNCVQVKSVCIYPNNKNWFTKDLKLCLNERKEAFMKGDKELVK